MLRFGIVTNVDEKRAMVRVNFQDMDGTISYWLPVLVPKSHKDRYYYMPDIGEHVVCLMDETCEEGVVLGAIYSEADNPPERSKDKYHIKFADGTTIEYDRAEHKLRADVKGDVSIKVTGRCDVNCQNQIFIRSATNITIQAPSLNMKGGSPAEGEFEGNFRIRGNLYVYGNIETEGNINASGSIIDAGGNTNHHNHY